MRKQRLWSSTCASQAWESGWCLVWEVGRQFCPALGRGTRTRWVWASPSVLTDFTSGLSLQFHVGLLARPWVASQRPKPPRHIWLLLPLGRCFLLRACADSEDLKLGTPPLVYRAKITDCHQVHPCPPNSKIQHLSKVSLYQWRYHCIFSFLLREWSTEVLWWELNAKLPLLANAVSKSR